MRFEAFRSIIAGERSALIPFWEVWFHKDHLLHHQHGAHHLYEAQVRVAKELGMAAIRIGGVPLNCTFARHAETAPNGAQIMTGGLTSLDQLDQHRLPLWTGLSVMLKDHYVLAHEAGLGGVMYQPFGLQAVVQSMGETAFVDKVYSDREFVRRAIAWVSDRNRGAIQQVIREVIPDAVLFDGTGCCNADGLIIRNEDFRDLVEAETTETMDYLRECRIPAIFSAGGAVHELLPILIDMGFNACHGIDSRYNDLTALSARFGDDIALIGNMDPAFLARASILEIQTETTRMLQNGHHKGRFLASCQPGPTDAIPDAHYLAFCETIRTYIK
jgi:hypothetical protein